MKEAIICREADLRDIPFITSMLLEACDASGVHITSENLSDFPETEIYIKGWTPEKEIGVIAETSTGYPVGAVWIRHLTELGHSVNEPLPELTIAVSPTYRKRGIASQLMESLYGKAK